MRATIKFSTVASCRAIFSSPGLLSVRATSRIAEFVGAFRAVCRSSTLASVRAVVRRSFSDLVRATARRSGSTLFRAAMRSSGSDTVRAVWSRSGSAAVRATLNRSGEAFDTAADSSEALKKDVVTINYNPYYDATINNNNVVIINNTTHSD